MKLTPSSRTLCCRQDQSQWLSRSHQLPLCSLPVYCEPPPCRALHSDPMLNFRTVRCTYITQGRDLINNLVLLFKCACVLQYIICKPVQVRWRTLTVHPVACSCKDLLQQYTAFLRSRSMAFVQHSTAHLQFSSFMWLFPENKMGRGQGWKKIC